ncbi:unnamed protein product [Didymodactylos carnosus]|uniref:AIG1-type G domain-containing protein n=1 Tax=Didymodactylos carnosus TaxID=1234261 RepID=A0A8S2I4V2_9BILA|nr:unnamed protein product [Didymodactylos carnosus]
MAASYDIPDLFETAPRYTKEQFDEIIKKADEKYNKYKFNKCVARNIVLIGRSRSASTLIQSNTVFHFNVIDTPGFYETARSSETKLSNEQIQDYINRCIKNDVTQIHVFAFVFSLDVRHKRRLTTRNIVLIGRSRSGKSTIAHVIEDFKYVPPLRKFYSETREIEFHKIASTLIQSNTVFHFNVIDTPGFYETARSSETKLSNEQIQDHINRCIKNDVTQILVVKEKFHFF